MESKKIERVEETKTLKRKPILEARNVSITFGGLCAVNDVSFTLYEKELVGLIGPNGAGKTTLFNMVSGVYTPSEGQLLYTNLKGQVVLINKFSSDKLNKLGVSRTFQNIRLFNNLSVLDNVLIALHNASFSSPLDVLLRTKKFRRCEEVLEHKAHHLLSLFNLDEKCKELSSNLSYGEQRRLEIARALASSPRLLLLDEPAAGMNDKETGDLTRMIAFIREKFNLTILLIEHDMRLVMNLCERIMVLNYGSIIASGVPEEIKSNPDVIKAYLGEDE